MHFVPDEPDGEMLRVPVLRVFDGDGFLTKIWVADRNRELELAVRFAFIDAPEMDQPGGPEAREFLNSLIAGKWLDLEIRVKMDTGRIVDRHGRIVAVPYLRQGCFKDETKSPSTFRRLMQAAKSAFQPSRNIELEMVLNGWAWVLDRYGPDVRYFEALEDARRHRRGIWAWTDNVHPWEFKTQRHENKKIPKAKPQSPPAPLATWRCPSKGCVGYLVQRSGRYGDFYGCSEFPKCRYSCRR